MITEIHIQNYKSIADAKLTLGPLTVLVGQNGAGKSNLLDAFAFVKEALEMGSGLERALMKRGGISAVRRHQSSDPIRIKLTFALQDFEGSYSFEIAVTDKAEFSVLKEECIIGEDRFWIEDTTFQWSKNQDSIGLPRFRTELMMPSLLHFGTGTMVSLRLWQLLGNVVHYSIFPDNLRVPQIPSSTNVLMEDGSNLSSILREMKNHHSGKYENLRNSLSVAIPSISNIDIQSAGSFLLVNIYHQYENQNSTLELLQESDGTLRLLTILTALYQNNPPKLIALEEPEANVHPGTMAILYDVMKEASLSTQILATTHSPDFISLFDIEELRVVELVGGVTQVGPLSEDQVEVLNRQLFTTGDLLRIEGLKPRIR